MIEYSIVNICEFDLNKIISSYMNGTENGGRKSFDSHNILLDKNQYSTDLVSSQTFFCDLKNVELVEVVKKYIHINDDYEYVSNIHYIKYILGEEAKPHTDDYISDKTFIILLNDNFEGGEFYLNKKLVPLKKGDLLKFDSLQLHEVKKIRKGTREVLVIFVKKKIKNKKSII
jgi:hypothetical protein